MDSTSDVKIIPMPLDINFSDKSCQIIIVQPLCRLQKTTSNGFKIDESIRASHRILIEKTLDLAGELKFGNENLTTNFLLYPELSLLFDALPEVRKRITDSWPNNSVLIGGIEGISIDQYNRLLEESDNPADAKYSLSGTTDYVNCSIVVVKKSQNEEIKFYLQPKIKPSKEEQGIGMREGQHIFLFTATNLNFICLVCFDTIAEDSGFKTLVTKIMDNLRELAIAGKIPKNMLDKSFILMHNKEADHMYFQESALNLLSNRGRDLNSDHGSVVFINVAQIDADNPDHYGKSALYYSKKDLWYVTRKDEYPPPETYCVENTDYNCQRARFRENGASLHTFCYIPYRAESHTAAGTYYPLKNLTLYRIKEEGTLDSPQSVPAIKKIVSVNLPLDLAIRDNCSRWHAPNNVSLDAEIKRLYKVIRDVIINMREEKINDITTLLLLSHYCETDRTKNPDCWEKGKEGEAIKELASALSLFTLLGDMSFGLASKIITGLVETRFYIAILDGKGEKAQAALLCEYCKFVEQNPYDINIFEKNTLLILTRHRGAQPSHEVAEEIEEISKISRKEEKEIPEELREDGKYTSKKTIRFFWHSSESLRDAVLGETSVINAKSKLEEKIGSVTS